LRIFSTYKDYESKTSHKSEIMRNEELSKNPDEMQISAYGKPRGRNNKVCRRKEHQKGEDSNTISLQSMHIIKGGMSCHQGQNRGDGCC
jgi:hypothetical protein